MALCVIILVGCGGKETYKIELEGAMFTVSEIAGNETLLSTALSNNITGTTYKGLEKNNGDDFVIADLEEHSGIETIAIVSCSQASELEFMFKCDIKGMLQVVIYNGDNIQSIIKTILNNGSGEDIQSVNISLSAGENTIAVITDQTTGEYMIWNLLCEGASIQVQ